jgi:hypothetical protein
MATPLKLTILVTGLVATLFATTDAEAQRWRRGGRSLSPPPGPGRLRNAAQGMCLDVAGWAGKGNADVLLWECNDDPDHVWSFTPGGELRNNLNGTCLDVAGYRGEQGANVDVYRCESLDDQRWTLVNRGRGTFELRNVKRGLCLDVNGRVGARGDDVMLWACDGGADQLWSFEAYTPPSPAPPSPPQRERAHQRPRPMEDGPFRALAGSVRNESFSDAQLAVIQQATTRNYFRVGQITNLMDQVSFSATKLRVLELCVPRVVDPENAFAVYEALTFSTDKDQAKVILQRHGI